VIEEKFPEGVSFANALKSGVILCKLINRISPNSVPKINTRDIAYQQMVFFFFFSFSFFFSFGFN